MAFLRKSPILRQMIKSTTAFEIRLNNGVTIAIHTNSFRLIRGKTLLACVFDEIAFWRDDTSANPDVETYRAVRPSLARTDGMLIGISSPYRRSGLIYSKFRDHYDVEDAFTACIGHCEGAKGEEAWTGDVVRGRLAPFDPRTVAEEYAALARSYGCTKITGDAFAGEWVGAAFRDGGMRYEVSPLTKSSLYLEALPFFNRGAVHIPDHGLLLRELRGLERRVHRSGKDSVDHGARGSDDHANALGGALYLAIHASRKPKIWINGKSVGRDAATPAWDQVPAGRTSNSSISTSRAMSSPPSRRSPSAMRLPGNARRQADADTLARLHLHHPTLLRLAAFGWPVRPECRSSRRTHSLPPDLQARGSPWAKRSPNSHRRHRRHRGYSRRRDLRSRQHHFLGRFGPPRIT